MKPLTIECQVHFDRRTNGRKTLEPGPADPRAFTPGRVPRIAKLTPLAIRFDELVREGVVADYAELARLGRVSRARVSQISNLTLLAPSIQEAILFLPRIEKGKDRISLLALQSITLTADWRKQQRMWGALRGA